MKIAMVASEARPYAKTGGLADVVYSLSKELVVMTEKPFIIIPFYDSFKHNPNYTFSFVKTIKITMSWRKSTANIYKSEYEGIPFYFIENAQYFERGHLYGDFDDGERFAFFSLAVKELFISLKLIPDIIHVHDWHVGMLPTLIKEDNKALKLFKNTHYVLTIHNPAFQGLYPKTILGDFYGLKDELYDNGQLRFKDQVSTLKSAITYVDKLTTVSPNHHLELLTKEGSMGLSDVLKYREYDFTGILNGIDYLEFNPEDDKNITKTFNIKGIDAGKRINKKALLEQLKIKDDSLPTFALVTRITWQKGFDIIFPCVKELMKHNVNVIMLGSGEAQYEKAWEELRNAYPDNIAIYIGYNDSLAHQIYASSDFFLMPSLFEPCGLGQMIAERYACLPIVRRTGGLKDSVICFDGNNQNEANGFGFDDYDYHALLEQSLKAIEVYKNKNLLKQLRINAYATDNSWRKSATEYLKLYKSIK